MMLQALATAFQPRSIRCHPLLPVTARLTESDFLSSPGASLRSYALTAPHGDFQPPLTRQRGRLSGPTIGGLSCAHLVPSVHKCAHCTLGPSVHRPSDILCTLGQATIERCAHWILQCAHSVLEVCIAVCTGGNATVHT